MTQVLDLDKNLRVLEIGTGSGYQSYILSRLVRFVYTIERHYTLSKTAQELLKKLGVKNVFLSMMMEALDGKNKHLLIE